MIVMLIGRFVPEVYGGAEQQCLRLSRELARRGRCVGVLTSRQTFATRSREIIDGVLIRRFYTPFDPQLTGRYFVGSLLWTLQLASWFLRNHREVRLIHVHQLKLQAYLGCLFGRMLRVPCVVKPGNAGQHSDIANVRRKPLIGRTMIRTILRDTDRFIAISSAIRDELIDNGVPAARVASISNGIEMELSFDQIDRLRWPVQASGENWERVFLFAGRLEAVKNVSLLLQSFPAAGPKSRLLIAGTGSLRAELERSARQLGLDGRVAFVGFHTNPRELMHCAHFFVLSSVAEGMSNALLEAMSSGLVPISTPVSGSRDLIVHGKSGFLANDFSTFAFEQALRAASAVSQAQLRAMSRAAFDAVENKCGMNSVASRIEAVYNELTH